MRIDWAHTRPIDDVAHDGRLSMICGGVLMESFAGLLRILVVWWIPPLLVGVGARIYRELTPIHFSRPQRRRMITRLHGKVQLGITE